MYCKAPPFQAAYTVFSFMNEMLVDAELQLISMGGEVNTIQLGPAFEVSRISELSPTQ